MNEFKIRLVQLHHCQGVSWNLIYSVLKKDPQLKYLYNNEMLSFISSHSSSKSILQDLKSKKYMNDLLTYKKMGIKIITIFDEEYPQLLRETYQPPWVLYTIGNLQYLKQTRLLAVVGARLATTYGKKTIEILFPTLIEEKYVIVSGLAAGIDGHAHKMTMNLGGETIGVIAGGFHHLYPKENVLLGEEMMKKQLIISEYPPFTVPQKWHFPMRNRIIAGISHGTLVIEAKKRSGSLITANYAVQEGREVFAVPGPISSTYSTGTNELIQQGAKLVMNPQDILEEFFYIDNKS